MCGDGSGGGVGKRPTRSVRRRRARFSAQFIVQNSFGYMAVMGDVGHDEEEAPGRALSVEELRHVRLRYFAPTDAPQAPGCGWFRW